MLFWKNAMGKNKLVNVIEFIPVAYPDVASNTFCVRVYVRYRYVGSPHIYDSQFEDLTVFNSVNLPKKSKYELINSANRQRINKTATFSGKFGFF